MSQNNGASTTPSQPGYDRDRDPYLEHHPDSHQTFLLPPLQPLERLYIFDGLLMNRDRWLQTEKYYRQRQNVQFQALHQPGIVYGLGVKVLTGNDIPQGSLDTDELHWIEIEQGLAIDLEGNPIVVKLSQLDSANELKFPIRHELDNLGTVGPPPAGWKRNMVCVVLNYTYNEKPANQRRSGDPRNPIVTVPERFGIELLTHPPRAGDIELCRIELKHPVHQLANPKDPLNPQPNELDFRFRPHAKLRPQSVVRVAHLDLPLPGQADSPIMQEKQRGQRQKLAQLIQAIPSLYPTLEGEVNLQPLSLKADILENAYDLLYVADGSGLPKLLQDESDRQLSNTQLLRRYLESGGTLLVETPNELNATEASAQADPQAQLQTFLASIATKLSPSHLSSQSFQEWRIPSPAADPLGSRPDAKPYSELAWDHPLRQVPFLFGEFPAIGTDRPALYYHPCGVIVIRGRLSVGWGLDPAAALLPRNDIRAAQELGINILHFACYRRSLSRLSQWNQSKTVSPSQGG